MVKIDYLINTSTTDTNIHHSNFPWSLDSSTPNSHHAFYLEALEAREGWSGLHTRY